MMAYGRPPPSRLSLAGMTPPPATPQVRPAVMQPFKPAVQPAPGRVASPEPSLRPAAPPIVSPATPQVRPSVAAVPRAPTLQQMPPASRPAIVNPPRNNGTPPVRAGMPRGWAWPTR